MKHPSTQSDYHRKAIEELYRVLEGRYDHAGQVKLDAGELYVPKMRSRAMQRMAFVWLIDERSDERIEIIRIPSYRDLVYLNWPAIVGEMYNCWLDWRKDCQEERSAA